MEDEDGGDAPFRVYITQSYASPYATINSVWAAAREHGYVPDCIHLLTPDPGDDDVVRLQKGLEALQHALGKEPDVQLVEDDPEDFEDTASTVSDLIATCRGEGHRVAADVTPGRTIPKVALFDACARNPPDHLFYLSVPDYDYRDELYLNVPFRLQNSLDLVEVIKRDG